MKPPKRTKQEVIEKEVMDRLTGKPKCTLGYCATENVDMNMMDNAMDTDSARAMRRDICPKCGYPGAFTKINIVSPKDGTTIRTEEVTYDNG